MLRELHKKIIQSSTQAIKEQPSGPAVAETVTDAPSPSMSPTSAAAAMSPSLTILIPFNIRVEEKLDEAGPVWPENAGSDELAQSVGWKVVSEDAAVLYHGSIFSSTPGCGVSFWGPHDIVCC